MYQVTFGLPPYLELASFASMKALKNDEKCFLFHLENSFGFQDS